MSQNTTKNWFFGTNAGLTFTGSVTSVTPNGLLTNSLSSAAISSTSGALAFYTDGVTIYTSQHTVMANGTGLLGNSASQPALIIPHPVSNNLYYVFTVGGHTTSNGLYYSIVDMSLASGNGSVTTKNVLVYADARDKITAGKHCNNQDIWIVATTVPSATTFVACLLTSSGITSIVPTPNTACPGVIGLGQIKLSPNSKRLGINSSTVNTASWFIDSRVAEFNTSTGIVSTFSVIQYGLNYQMSGASLVKSHGCEFSPNSRYFYYTFYNTVTKLDLCNTLSLSTTVYLPESQTEDTANKRMMQLAPDGRIYVAMNGKSAIGIINNPNNTQGVASFTTLSLGTTTTQWGLPNFAGYLFEQQTGTTIAYTVNPVACLQASFSPTDMCSSSGYSITNYSWQFGDINSGAANTSSNALPTHIFSAAGTYTVRLIRSFVCHPNDTAFALVTVAQPSLSVTIPPLNCSVASASATISGGIGPFNYTWTNSTQTTATSSFSVSGNQIIYVKDIGSGNCILSQSFAVNITTLSANLITQAPTCFGLSNGACTVNVNGGSGNSFFALNSGSFTTSNQFSNLAAGLYTLQIVNPNSGCVLTKSLSIVQPPQLQTFMATPNSTAICVGDSFVGVVNVSGGTAPYTYQWMNNGTVATTTVMSGTAGMFHLKVSVVDGMGCLKNDSIPYTVLPLPVLSVTGNSVCAGSAALLVASGASQYTWQPGAVISPSLYIPNPSSTAYTLTGQQNGCQNQIVDSLIVFQSPSIQLTSNSPVCAGQTVSLSINSTLLPQWTGPSSFTASLPNPIITSSQVQNTGSYSATVTNQFGCSKMDSIYVLVNPTPQLSITGNTMICKGNSLLLIANGAPLYTWYPVSTTGAQLLINPVQNTTYTLVGNNSTCQSSLAVNVHVDECASINELNKQLDVAVMPNPANTVCRIGSLPEGSHLQIVDLQGRQIYQLEKAPSVHAVDCEVWPAGVYFVTVTCGSFVVTKKLVIVH